MADGWTVAGYLARRLEQAGVRHVFGVPGDYVLPFFDALESGACDVVVTCNELNAGYAADAYARLNGVGAVAATWNVGGLSLLNAVAGAFTERVPVIAVCGAPRTYRGRRTGVAHHAARVADAQYRAYRAVTGIAVRVTDPAAAPAQLDAAVAACLRERLPAFVELPLDVSQAPCRAPGALASTVPPASDPGALDEAAARTAAMLTAAARGAPPAAGAETAAGGPGGAAVMAGLEVQRSGLGRELLALIEHLGCPFVTTIQSKTVLPETHPLYAGTYIGALGASRPREAVEGAGVVLSLGNLMSDLDLGLGTARLDPRRLVLALAGEVRIGRRRYRRVSLGDLIAELGRRSPAGLCRVAGGGATASSPPPPASFVADPRAPVTVRRFFARLQDAITPRSVVLADVGDALLSAAGLSMPDGAVFLGQATYASLGWSVPATLGAACAAPDRRAVTFVGDGALRMTAQELSTIVQHRQAAVVFVLDNGGFASERHIHDGPYNDVAGWRYAALPEVFGGAPGPVVETEGQLEAALAHAEARPDEPVLVQVRLGRRDASETLLRFADTYR